MFYRKGSGPLRFGAGTSVAGLHVDALEEVLQLGRPCLRPDSIPGIERKYPLVRANIAVENHHVSWENPL